MSRCQLDKLVKIRLVMGTSEDNYSFHDPQQIISWPAKYQLLKKIM
jgi:hypothetical protein